jgi:hypothetical protein
MANSYVLKKYAIAAISRQPSSTGLVCPAHAMRGKQCFYQLHVPNPYTSWSALQGAASRPSCDCAPRYNGIAAAAAAAQACQDPVCDLLR